MRISDLKENKRVQINKIFSYKKLNYAHIDIVCSVLKETCLCMSWLKIIYQSYCEGYYWLWQLFFFLV